VVSYLTHLLSIVATNTWHILLCYWNRRTYIMAQQLLAAQNWSKYSLSLTNKTLQSQKPSYLYNLLNLQANTSTRSSTVITLQCPSVNSRLKITDRSFTYHVPALCNSLTKDLCYSLSLSYIYHTQQIITFSLSPHLSFTANSSLPPIIPALVCLHLYIVGSLVHSTWLYSHFTSLSLSLYHSYHVISCATWPTIVQ